MERDRKGPTLCVLLVAQARPSVRVGSSCVCIVFVLACSDSDHHPISDVITEIMTQRDHYVGANLDLVLL